MKFALVALIGIAIGPWVNVGWAEMTPEQLQKAEAFKAGVHALNPHTIDSEPAFQALVKEHVPVGGSVQGFLEFMTTSGFECPVITSLAEDAERKVPIYSCTFQPDLGASGEPSLSSVIEVSWFGVTADTDQQRRFVRVVEGYMSHSFLGP